MKSFWNKLNRKNDGSQSPYPHLSLGVLETCFKHLPRPVWIRNDQGQLIYANHIYAQLFEESLDETLENNRLIFDVLNKEKYDLSAPLSEQRCHIIIDGERRYFRFYEIAGEEGIIYGYGGDLSEVELTQAKLENYITSFREVLDNLSAGVIIYGPDRRLKYYNDAYLKMFSFEESLLSSDPTMGEVLDDLKNRRQLTEYADYQAFRTKEVETVTSIINHEQRLMHIPDGRAIRMLASPHPLGGSFYIFEDVTGALDQERKINTQLAVYSATLDNLYEGIAVFGPDNRLKISNPAFCKIWNISSDQLKLDSHISELADHSRSFVEGVANWEAYKSRVIEKITDRIPKKSRIQRGDGRILDFSYVPLPDGSNLLSYVDCTDSVQIETVLREKNDALEAADKLKSDFIANVSYELRTPLNTIIGFTEILTNQYFGPLNPQQITYCHNILASSQTLLTLVNDILDLAMIQAGYMNLNTTQQSLSNLLKDSLQLVMIKAETKKIKLLPPDNIPLIYLNVDESRFNQAIFNILMNLIKFTHEGETIHITFQSTPDHLKLSFKSSGLVPQAHSHLSLVDLIDQTSEHPDKTPISSLSFALVRSIMGLFGGEASLHSQAETGTLIEITFPQDVIQTAHQTPKKLDPLQEVA